MTITSVSYVLSHVLSGEGSSIGATQLRQHANQTTKPTHAHKHEIVLFCQKYCRTNKQEELFCAEDLDAFFEHHPSHDMCMYAKHIIACAFMKLTSPILPQPMTPTPRGSSAILRDDAPALAAVETAAAAGSRLNDACGTRKAELLVAMKASTAPADCIMAGLAFAGYGPQEVPKERWLCACVAGRAGKLLRSRTGVVLFRERGTELRALVSRRRNQVPRARQPPRPQKNKINKRRNLGGTVQLT